MCFRTNFGMLVVTCTQRPHRIAENKPRVDALLPHGFGSWVK
ncbi:hypothetical protein [Streptomyces sp. NPDC007346]